MTFEEIRATTNAELRRLRDVAVHEWLACRAHDPVSATQAMDKLGVIADEINHRLKLEDERRAAL